MAIRGELQEPEFRVIGVDLDQGKRNLVRVRVIRVKLTEKWCQIQGKWDLVRVSAPYDFVFCCLE